MRRSMFLSSSSPQTSNGNFKADKSLHHSDPYFKDRLISICCAVAAHCSIGGIYTFSLFIDAFTRNNGVVISSSFDWNASQVVPIFSLTIGVAGLTAALSGKWAEKVGPRLPIVFAGLFGLGVYFLFCCILILKMYFQHQFTNLMAVLIRNHLNFA